MICLLKLPALWVGRYVFFTQLRLFRIGRDFLFSMLSNCYATPSWHAIRTSWHAMRMHHVTADMCCSLCHGER